MIGGVYALAAAGVVVAGLSITSYALYQKAEAAEARNAVVTAQRDHAVAAIKRSEEANAKLRELNDALNVAIVERDKRAQALEAAKRALTKELGTLRERVSDEDKACLDRSLPQSFADRLRDS